MIDSNVEQYFREHQERVRRLEELYDKLRSPEYNDEQKKNFRHESLELCLRRVGACIPYWLKFGLYLIVAVSVFCCTAG
jgi:hypothetical protein